MRSYMIKISVGIAYEQNRLTGVAFALRAQFGFWAKSALKMHCTKFFFRQKLLQITICNFWCKNVFDRPTGVAFALRAQFSFWAKSALKMHCTKFFFRQKLLQITIHNFWCKIVFDRPTGVASVLKAQFGFLVKSALKMRCTKFLYQTKVITNQYPQLLCYVTFFDILHHYGVIAASLYVVCVEKVLCRLTEQFFFSFNQSAGLINLVLN